MRSGNHPNPEMLSRFARAAASRAERMEVVAHLLSRCPLCAEMLRSLMGGPFLDPDVSAPVLKRPNHQRCRAPRKKEASS